MWLRHRLLLIIVLMHAHSPSCNANLQVRGLATDVSNYTPVKEPFLSPQNQAVLSNAFYQWNPVFDESTYVGLLSNAFANAGVPDLGFIM